MNLGKADGCFHRKKTCESRQGDKAKLFPPLFPFSPTDAKESGIFVPVLLPKMTPPELLEWKGRGQGGGGLRCQFLAL